ncbi:large ribosomal subunit protein uL18m-like [Ylistrum balloti]|uniref:large ribosomal subunit protein uL18m-like n=1 Tax=Ylistrum balloti TaxID=509963 RepID=UPI002905BA52|nr:large ribosomal subunit protein uL18m-like [Ylistrum balloti]
MALLLGGRLNLPLSTGTLTCFCRNVRCCSVSTANSTENASPNANYKINPVFRNRNPRNLEKMALARKPQGWQFQDRVQKSYHLLSYKMTDRKTSASVKHLNGKFTIKFSTDTPEMKHVFTGSDCGKVKQAYYVGQVIAQRCLEAGITQVHFDPLQGTIFPKYEAFLAGVESMNLELTEPDVITPTYCPGIDYSKPNRYAERKKYRDDHQMA